MPFPEKILEKLRDLPDKPGCYLMRDRRGQIIYIGKAVSLRKRVVSYFRQSAMRRAPPKLRGLLRSVADFDFMVLPSEEAATLMEGRLIKDYRPRYNTLFKDDKRFPLLRIDPRRPFPAFRLCRIRRDDGAEYFGPYTSSAVVYAAREFLERHFGLRRCTPVIPGPKDHRHCLDDIIRFCSAPCLGRITPDEYRRRVMEACAFLRGERPELLQTVADAMRAAAAAMQYERAAALRDTLELLSAAVRRRRRARLALPRADHACAGLAELGRHLRLSAPPRLIEACDISNISGTHAVGSVVAAVDGIPRPARYRRFRVRTVTTANDVAMLAEVVRRRFERLLREGASMPDLLLIDGGITQLRAVRAELQRLGLQHLPAAGLAKRHEEIHLDTPAGPQILRLPPDSPALLILRRLRDEAHRFALDYHRRLRGRRIRESRLDEIPGIGPRRKRLLIEKFGSMTRLEKAAPGELAAVPGIGPELAGLIHAALSEP